MFLARLAVFSIILASSAWACYECGASERGSFSGSGDSGTLPRDKGNLVSLRYSYREIPGLAVYQGVMLSGRFSFGGRIEVNFDFPFSSIKTEIPVTNVPDTLSAGDLMFGTRLVAINAPLFDSKEAPETSLVFGSGVKLPTSGFVHGVEPADFNARLAHGSGSVDFKAQADFGLQWKYWGMSFSSLGWLTTPGAYGYQFGHRLSFGGGVFGLLRPWEMIRFRPGIGLSWEGILPDTWKGAKVATTGQDAFFAGLSFDASFKDFQVSLAYRRPFTDYGRLALKVGEDRFSAMVGYFF